MVAGKTAAEHEAGVRASLAWYEDVFAVHGISTRSDDALWWALSDPPPWHSAAKTVRRDVTVDRVLRAMEPFEHCSVADSYGTVDLAPAGFQQLFEADWLHREAASPQASLPKGWGVVSDPDELGRWNELHDYTGVLLPAFLEHPRFTILAQRESEELVGGAVLHEAGATVELSNAWAAGGQQEDVAAMVACAAVLHPGRALVGYAHGDELGRWIAAGFHTTGPQVVWVR
ncbi:MULTISPECIES: hypothetical protein [unclassified Knoellia]|uniref:hypothetical protein n=1 Tax=Knoellia altitudinis TaxID=3404795 RepID=UPI0036118811